MVKRVLLLAISAGYYALTRVSGWFFPRWFAAGNVILYYHGVADRQREAFRRQMQWLCRRRRIVPLSQIMDGDAGKRCSITFDDAISNILANAMPVLKELQLPATVFAVSGNLGEEPQWKISASDPDAQVKVMTARELAELPRQGIQVGSHTVTHRALSDLSLEEVRAELVDSRRQLEAAMHQPVRFLSVPYGAVHPQLPAIAAGSGYGMVVTSAPQLVTRESGPLCLGRFGVSPDDWKLEFRLKALGAYAWRRFLPRHRHGSPIRRHKSQLAHSPAITMQVQRGC